MGQKRTGLGHDGRGQWRIGHGLEVTRGEGHETKGQGRVGEQYLFRKCTRKESIGTGARTGHYRTGEERRGTAQETRGQGQERASVSEGRDKRRTIKDRTEKAKNREWRTQRIR